MYGVVVIIFPTGAAAVLFNDLSVFRYGVVKFFYQSYLAPYFPEIRIMCNRRPRIGLCSLY